MSFEMYDDWIKDQYNDSLSQFKYMKEKLNHYLMSFDVIYLDVPPSISVYSKSAMYMRIGQSSSYRPK